MRRLATNDAHRHGRSPARLRRTTRETRCRRGRFEPRWFGTVTLDAARTRRGRRVALEKRYDGYDGATIKQADVVLLGFPLDMNMTHAVRRADLDYYEAGRLKRWCASS